MRTYLVTILACASLVGAVRSSAAQPAAQAEALFERGKKLMGENKIAEACTAFESSQKLDPLVTTLLNLAACREKNKELASAWARFVEAERQTRGKTGGEKKLNQTAKDRASKLQPLLSKLTIEVKQPVDGLQLARDGTEVDRGTWNTPLPIDGGTFTIVARAPGYQEWSTRITVATERDQKVVEVPVLQKAKVTVPPPGDGGTRPPVGSEGGGGTDGDDGDDTEVTPMAGPSRTVPIALAVAGAVLAGTAIGVELWGASKYDMAELEENDAEQEALWKAANARRYTAVALGSAAAVCVGVSVFMFVRSSSKSAETQQSARRVRVQPVAGLGLTGLLVHGDF